MCGGGWGEGEIIFPEVKKKKNSEIKILEILCGTKKTLEITQRRHKKSYWDENKKDIDLKWTDAQKYK